MKIVQDFKDGIKWYQPTIDTDSWKWFYKYCYNIDYKKANSETLKRVAWKSSRLKTSVDEGMWATRKKRLEIFLSSNISLNGDDPYLQEAIQYELVACFINSYSEASHNSDLWKSINNSAIRVLKKAYSEPKKTEQMALPSPRWLLPAIPAILYRAIKKVRLSYYSPTVDADTWHYFQNVVFDISLLDNFHFCYNSTFLLTNVSSPVDSGMWSSVRSGASAFLDANLGRTPNTTQTQTQMAINFCDILVFRFNHSAHNESLWKIYSEAFKDARNDLTLLHSKHTNVERDSVEESQELNTPRRNIANDTEVWSSSSIIEMETFVNPSGSGLWDNFYDSSFGFEVWHPQHVVRLPNKNGCAYFMVSQSREYNGYITVLKTDPGVLDLTTDLIDVKSGDTPVGKYIWQDVYTGEFNGTINPVGNWNHPGKMDVMGGVLLIAAQNWDHGSMGTSIDKILFYDVSDPEHPSYWGAIDAHELNVKEVATVGLVRTPQHGYLLCAGGNDSYATLAADKISPNIKDWTRLDPDNSSWAGQHVFSGQHGMNFNSYQKRTKLSERSMPDGVERPIYFDASSDSFTFTDYDYDSSTGMLLSNPTMEYSMDLPGAKRDWNTSSLYVTEYGVPIVYTVKSGDWQPYKLYQVHNS